MIERRKTNGWPVGPWLFGLVDLARRFALGQAMRTNGPLARNNVAVLSTATLRWSWRGREVLLGKQDLRAVREKAEAGKAPEQELNEIRVKISQTERKLAHLMEIPHSPQDIPPQFRAQAEKLELAARRLQHIRVAAENLKAAEMHDMAQDLMKKAEAMQHEMHAAKTELAKLMQNGKGKDQGQKGELQQLRSENEQLRREMKELQEVIGQLRKDTDK